MIYIVAHKRAELPRLEGYVPMQVSADRENYPGFVRDDTGDNIACKNATFCELTAMYWIWRNTDDEYKGLVHYRRYFGARAFSSNPGDIMPVGRLNDLLGSWDIVVARPACYHVNAREQLLMDCCTADTFRKLESAMEELHPECMEAFSTFFSGNRASQYNMLYCRRELFDAYCEWLFPVLFHLEGVVDLSGVSDYQKRLYGFLGERLLNVWIAHNELRAKRVPVVSTAYTPRDHWTYFRRDITNALRFKLAGGK